MEAVVNVDARAGDAGGEGRAEERGGLTNLHRAEGLLVERSVGHGVVDHVIDEADGLGGAGAEGTGRDGVNTDTPLVSSLVRKHLGVGLERSLGGGHTAAVAGDDLLGGEVGEGDGGAALVHVRTEALEKGHLGVRGGGESGEVTVTGGLEKGLLHLGAVGEGVDKDVDLAVLLRNLGGAVGDGEALVTGVTLVGAHLLGHVIVSVVHGVERVDTGELHERTVGQLTGLVELSAAERSLEDLKRGHPRAEDHLAASLGEALGDGPGETLIVGDAGDESLLACCCLMIEVREIIGEGERGGRVGNQLGAGRPADGK